MSDASQPEVLQRLGVVGFGPEGGEGVFEHVRQLLPQLSTYGARTSSYTEAEEANPKP